MATVAVPFYPGNGVTETVEVAYISDYPRDEDDFCAFCHGDPCAEEGGDTPIARYFERNRSWAETCPMCDGRPS